MRPASNASRHANDHVAVELHEHSPPKPGLELHVVVNAETREMIAGREDENGTWPRSATVRRA